MSASPLIGSRVLDSGLVLELRPLITMARAGLWLIRPRAGVVAGWLYDDEDAARRALEEWDGIGEPEGWARRPEW
jgi:hypothetical protein